MDSLPRLSRQKSYLIRCVLWGFAFELLWVLMLYFAGDELYKVTAFIFPMTPMNYWRFNYLGIMLLEISIILFYLVPLLAVWGLEGQE